MTRKIVEELPDGSKQLVWATVAYQDPTGAFISRADYLARREGVGYGRGGYGDGGYGSDG